MDTYVENVLQLDEREASGGYKSWVNIFLLAALYRNDCMTVNLSCKKINLQ